MNKCLILLTNASPDTKGESFVSNELSYLSKDFSKIIVLALDESVIEKVNISLPDNTDIYEVSKMFGKKAKLTDTFFGALGLIKLNHALRLEREKYNKSIKKALFAGYFESRANRKFKECLEVLNQYDFSAFDEVVVYSFWFFLTCRVAVLIKDFLVQNGVEASLVSRAHRYDLYPYANKVNYLPEREFLAENADYIYPCSKNGEQFLKSQIPAFADKIECAYLGTTDHGTGNYTNLFHIVTCSHSVPVKRLNKLIDALSLLKDKSIELYWTHIGDGVVQNELKAKAEEMLGFMDFEFLGRMDNAQVYEYYRTHPINLLVNVSLSEGLPVSIMEAISFGTPVLATDVGGTGEIVIDGFNGKLLSKDFTEAEFVDSFMKIYNMSDDEYKLLRTNARKYWEDNFDAEKNYTIFSQKISNIKIKTAI